MPDAQEVSALVHGHRQEPANLLDKGSFTLFFRAAACACLVFEVLLLIERSLQNFQHGQVAAAAGRGLAGYDVSQTGDDQFVLAELARPASVRREVAPSLAVLLAYAKFEEASQRERGGYMARSGDRHSRVIGHSACGYFVRPWQSPV